MTYQERKAIEEFCASSEKTIESSPVGTAKKAVQHIKSLTDYIDQLERELRR